MTWPNSGVAFSYDWGDGSDEHGSYWHEYASPGIYKISVTGTNATDSDTAVEVVRLSHRWFDVEVNGLKVSIDARKLALLDTDANPLNCDWGDASSITELPDSQIASHAYARGGAYKISLRRSTSGGADQYSEAVNVPNVAALASAGMRPPHVSDLATARRADVAPTRFAREGVFEYTMVGVGIGTFLVCLWGVIWLLSKQHATDIANRAAGDPNDVPPFAVLALFPGALGLCALVFVISYFLDDR